MDVTLHERSPVDFELEVRATSEELEPRITEALRAQRKRTNLKGFRPGRVPMSIVRKMYGSAIALQVAEQVVTEAYRDEVDENDELDVLGAPRLVEFDYDIGQDLRAVLRFGVRPAFEIADLSDAEVRRLMRTVTEEAIDEEIERRRRRAAERIPAEDEPVGEDSLAVLDVQPVDRASDMPIIGQREENQEVDLADSNLREELRSALLGKKAGDTFKVDLPHLHGPEKEHEGEHVDRLLVTVREVQHRELPELGEAFIEEQTAGQVETLEAFREQLRAEMEAAWHRMASDLMRGEMIEKTLERHDFPVPEAAVEALLDEMLEEAAEQAGGELPEGFDAEGYREARREEAERQLRWMLIREQLLEEEGIEIGEADYEAEFERMAESGPFDAAMLRQFVAAQPQLIGGIRDRILNDRLFAALERRFSVVEKPFEELEDEQEEA